MRPADIYIIGAADWDAGPLKIGRTTNSVWYRLASLQTGSPLRLKVLAYFEDEGGLERVLHQTFEPLRAHGEWFQHRLRLRQFVKALVDFTEGRRRATFEELECAGDAIISDEVPPYHEHEWEAYLASVNPIPFCDYLHDIAWAEFQAQRA